MADDEYKYLIGNPLGTSQFDFGEETYVNSVEGKTGDVTLNPEDVGLGNVTNDAQLAKDGSIPATGDLPMGGFKITGIGAPVASDDAARKADLDAHVGSGGTSQHPLVVAGGAAGFMSGADKAKLDGVEANAKDDQSAAEVPITDSGANYTATDVEGALAEEANARQAHEGAANPHSGSLGDSDLAANGGTVPETDRGNTFSADQTVNAILNATTLQEAGQRVGPIESGTWTPVLKGSVTAGNNTYIVQNGEYYRRGELVTVSCSVEIDSGGLDAAMDGALQIAGLPFAGSLQSALSIAQFRPFTLPSDFQQFVARIVNGINYIQLKYLTNIGSVKTYPTSALDDSGGRVQFYLSGTYFI